MTALLSVTAVTKRFRGLTAVDRVSFNVEAGEIFAAIGPNGAGKTTLFNLIAGVFAPDQGEIAFAGERIQINRQRRDQRLTFAGLHFGDFAVVQHDAADQLFVEMPHVDETAPCFAHRRKRGNHDVVKRRSLRQLFLEGNGLRGQFFVAELLNRGLQIVDRADHGECRVVA